MFKKYLNEILLFIIIILNLGNYIIYFYSKKTDPIEVIQSDQNIENDTYNKTEIKEDIKSKEYVEIKGAVKKPGVYAITNNTIINDIVVMAGGFKDSAYTNNINLSKKVNDQMVIFVYTINEFNNKKQSTIEEKIVTVYKECTCPTYDISSCVDNKESVIKNDNSTIKSDVQSEIRNETNTKKENAEINELNETQNNTSEAIKKININDATKEELMTLSGIGEAKAESIIKYRTENGKFIKCEDIIKVSGISEKIYEKIKEDITV